MGTYALAGGDEFRAAYRAPDRALVGLLPPGAGAAVIIPTAAAHQGPEAAITNGVRHFTALAPHLAVEGALVVDAASANSSQLAARIASAGLVYLTGGDPGLLVRILRGSEVLAAIAAVAARGGIVAGSSAGAMALGEQMRWGQGWLAALALVPGVVALPHHPDEPRPLAEVRAGLDGRLTVLGIPTGTLCVEHDAVWRVLGARPVTIYRAGGVERVGADQTFTL